MATRFLDNEGNEISAAEFCKAHPAPLDRWLEQAAKEGGNDEAEVTEAATEEGE